MHLSAMFGLSHKTALVLDHGVHMGESCKQSVELDVFTKSRAPGLIPLAPVSKSLWTCAVESAVEYCRILYDIFPSRKLVRFIVSDSEARSLNSWNQDEQSLQQISASLAMVGPPDPRSEPEYCSLLQGVMEAVEALCQCSELQHEARTSLLERAERVSNRGRILAITSLRGDSHVRMLEEAVQEAIQEHNKLAAGSDSLMPIQQCELVLVHTHPISDESCVSEHRKRELSPILSSEVYSVRAGRYLPAKLTTLVQQHFNLASTTITNIPMKEEQHANTSANYDVELLHHCDAHAELFKLGEWRPHACARDLSALTPGSSGGREGVTKETVTLKWCTPRTNSIELHYCTGAFRISPVDVNSRPSSCLTNFLLNGRSVMLEQPRKSGTKVIGHMLCSHGGEIFLHVLSSSRSTLEDPPSISEGCGGRVTDYRITDFGEFMKENRLAPVPGPLPRAGETPLDRARAQLERHTRYWPMIISQTTIFNMQAVVPLANLVVRASLMEDDVLECQKVVYHLVEMERKSDPLPISTAGTRGKGPKRDEQYRLMWNELETLVRAHAGDSPGHQRVLDCLLACRSSKPTEEDERKKGKRKKEEREERAERSGLRDPDAETDRFRERSGDKEEAAEPELIKDSPDSPEPVPSKRPRLSSDDAKPLDKARGPVSLLSMWTSRMDALHARKHQEFAGRLVTGAGGRAELYCHLKEDNGVFPSASADGRETPKTSRQ
ncbi:integrator complex subunit 13 isoform X1 [Lampetra fluviatilis]